MSNAEPQRSNGELPDDFPIEPISIRGRLFTYRRRPCGPLRSVTDIEENPERLNEVLGSQAAGDWFPIHLCPGWVMPDYQRASAVLACAARMRQARSAKTGEGLAKSRSDRDYFQSAPPNPADGSEAFTLLNYLLTSNVTPKSGDGCDTVGGWLVRLEQGEVDPKSADSALGKYGMKIVETNGRAWLAVANRHAALRKLLSGTRWYRRKGRTQVWREALKALPGTEAGKTLYFGGETSKCTLILLDLVFETMKASSAQNADEAK